MILGTVGLQKQQKLPSSVGASKEVFLKESREDSLSDEEEIGLGR